MNFPQFVSSSVHGNTSIGSFTDSDVDDEQLRSYFDGITKECDVFRILLVGKAGSGKSTIVAEVFDFDLDSARVHHFSVCALTYVTCTITD